MPFPSAGLLNSPNAPIFHILSLISTMCKGVGAKEESKASAGLVGTFDAISCTYTSLWCV